MSITTMRISEVDSNEGYSTLTTTIDDDDGVIQIKQDTRWVYIPKDVWPALLRDIRALQKLKGEK